MRLLPTREQLKRDIWRPDEPKLWVRKAWGYGWALNVAHLLGRTKQQ